MKCIVYRGGYKYQLKETYVFGETGIRPPESVGNMFLALHPSGALTVYAGYAWDGPSGPTIDTRNFMRGSLAHDALYQLMREGLLDHDEYRDDADRLLRKICREDGMSALRAWWVHLGVRLFGHRSADPENNTKPMESAPKGCGP